MRCDLASRTLITSMAILAIASLTLVPSASAEDPPVWEEPPVVVELTIYGYVYDVSDQLNIPMEGAVVQLMDAKTEVLQSTATDSEGRFEFTYILGEAKYLAFEYTGYTVRSLPDSMSYYTEDIFSFDLNGISPDADGKYALTTTADAFHSIGMRATNGILFGYVMGTDGGDTFPIENAGVTVTSVTGQSYWARTNSDGYFELRDIPYGTYSLKASCNGFASSEPIEASTGDGASMRIVLVENEFGIGILGGLDAPHAMMVVGMVVIGIVILLTLIAIHRSRRPESDIVILNDVDELEDEDGFNRP